MQARIIPGLPRHLPKDAKTGIYIGTVTSAKLDKSAVKRNRMRRRCKEALRLALKEKTSSFQLLASSSSYQLLIFPRSSSLSAPFAELSSDADRLLHFLPTLRVTNT
jgi:ribonuclease P protein component